MRTLLNVFISHACKIVLVPTWFSSEYATKIMHKTYALNFNAAKPFLRSLCSLYKDRNILIFVGARCLTQTTAGVSLTGKEGLISSQLEPPSLPVRTLPSAHH